MTGYVKGLCSLPSQKNNIAEMKRAFTEPALKKINEKTPLKTYATEEDGRLLFNFLDKKQ